ncbi:MAG: YitT family protein [Eubacterium sp.]|nr:YitT family protein [Eubacterium sp.]MBR1675341.1 YitT family protein [Eubacterium sp.]
MKQPLVIIRNNIVSWILLTAGAVIAAFSLEEFLVPNNIFDGGVTGISMIIGNSSKIPLAALVAAINIPFLCIALKKLGKKFILRAAYAMILFAMMIKVFDGFEDATEDLLLATVFGGVILGVGVGLVLRSGGCLDGTEIVGIMVNRKTNISVGNIVLAINIVIYIIAGAMFGIDRGMYSMLMYFITSKVIDIVEIGWEQAKAIMIITDNGEKIAEGLHENFGRTVTFIRGEGLISGTEKDILYCVVTRAEIFEIRKFINSLDVTAFTTITDVSEIIGRNVKQKPEA